MRQSGHVRSGYGGGWSRASALTLLVILFLVFGAVAVGPIIALTYFDTEAALVKAQADRLEQQLRLINRRAGREGGTRDNNAPSPFINGETEGIAAARLQQVVSSLARGAGVALQAVQVTQRTNNTGRSGDAEDAQGRILQLEANFETDISSLQSLLVSLETHVPLLAVTSLRVARQDGPAPMTVSPRLAVSLGVEARAAP